MASSGVSSSKCENAVRKGNVRMQCERAMCEKMHILPNGRDSVALSNFGLLMHVRRPASVDLAERSHFAINAF